MRPGLGFKCEDSGQSFQKFAGDITYCYIISSITKVTKRERSFMSPRFISYLTFIMLMISACTSLSNISMFRNPTPTSIAIATEPQLSATPSATVTVAEPTAKPHVTATAPLTAAISTPVVDLNDLSPYRQAMLPEHVEDIALVASMGVSRYHLDIALDPADFADGDALVLTGVERVHYTNTENVPLSDLYFRLYPNLPGYGGKMDVETVIVNDQLVEPELEAQDSALRVPLPATLQSNETADITLTYEAVVPTQTKQGYNIFVYNGGTATLAGFYPAVAVYDDEGWNLEVPPTYGDATYLDTALFQVDVTVPANMVVAASGSLLESQLNGDNTKTVSLASGSMRDFYLAMRADYEVVSETVNGVRVNSYYPPELAEGGQLALRYAVDALKIFNERFGPYPYAEFDVVATPTTAGGVEYPGIVAIAQGLYDHEGGFFEHATVHEVAHQWWYGLVGNDQIDEPWLDESLTNYSTVIYWETIRGEEAANQVIDNFFVRPYEAAKEQVGNKAVFGPVSSFSVGEYSAFVYGKGPLFFNALRQKVGDEMYFHIMQTYFLKYRYKIATSDNLFETIEQISGQNVEPLLETWLQGP